MSSGWGRTRHTAVSGGVLPANSTAKSCRFQAVFCSRARFLQPRDGATFPAGHTVYAREREAATTRPATLSTSGRNARWDMSRDQHMRCVCGGGGGTPVDRSLQRGRDRVTRVQKRKNYTGFSAQIRRNFPRKLDGRTVPNARS